MIIIVMAGEYSEYRTKIVLEVEGQRAKEKLKLVREKDSVEFQKNNVPNEMTKSK